MFIKKSATQTFDALLLKYNPSGLDFNNRYQSPKDLKMNNNITKPETASLKDLNNIMKSSTASRLEKVIEFLSYSYLIPPGLKTLPLRMKN